MAKSKYPDQLDTSVEIPAVRDNIVEIGSDVLNSVRMAIFQIERTLGINPQGAVGNTVSDRLSKALDGNGNILKEALDRANLLSGPITDSDVSKTAAINESKLRLNYPTTLLQDEISILVKQVDSMLKTIEEFAILLGAHVHPAATNRHMGQAITINSIENTTSPVGVTSLGTTTSQGAFESVFKSHINYDGTDISEANRSHKALQVFYDNQDTAAYIASADVQGAIGNVLDVATAQVDEHRDYQHSNSALKSTKLISASNSEEGMLVLDSEDIYYSESSSVSGASVSSIIFSATPAVPEISIERCDILKVTDGTGDTLYQISYVDYSADGLTIDSIKVYGKFLSASESGARAKIYKNPNRESNLAGLLITAREYQGLGSSSSYSNADILQVANPNAATIITRGIRPAELTLINRHFNISVDGGANVELSAYDGDLASTPGYSQTIDSVIKMMNSQFAENRLSVSAYRVDYEEGRQSELAIVHSMPSSSDTNRYITVSRSSDDALDSLGLTSFEDMDIDFGLGTRYYIQGRAFTGLETKLTKTGLTLLQGTSGVTSSSLNFQEEGVRSGDILVITNSTSDDGTYVVLSVTPTGITVDNTQLPGEEWAGEATDDTEFRIYKNSVSLNGLAFREHSSGDSACSVIDVFMDHSRNIFYEERLTYASVSVGAGESLVAISDFEGDVSVYEELTPGLLFADKVVPDPADMRVLLSLDSGPEVELNGTKAEYVTLYSGEYNIFIKVFIKDSDAISTKISGDSSFTVSLYGYGEINQEENLMLGRLLYESGVSRVAGAGRDYPRIFSKIRRGSSGYKDLGTDVVQNAIQRPMAETRSNGVIRGLEVINSIDNGSTYTISVSAGVCYVKGKRFELDKIDSYVTDIETGSGPSVDKLYVAINEWGQIVFKAADSITCGSPFDPSNYCILGTVENDGTTVSQIDLRLLISDLDLTLLNSITVSPQDGMGHFSSINKALKYAKRFSDIFPNAGVPTIHLKSGTHRVNVDYGVAYAGRTDQIVTDENYNQGIWINFPVTIEGEGDSTVLDISDSYTDYPISSDDRATEAGNAKNGNRIWVAGAGTLTTPAGDSDVLSSGFVTLKDFRMRMSWISFIDPDIKDGDGNKLNCGLNIDNVTFDWSENPTFAPERFGASLRDRQTAGVCGNLSIANCQFLNSSIYMGPNASDCRNISILNNVFRGTGIVAGDGKDNYAIYQSGAGNIFSIDDCPAVNNVQILGNINADNDGLTTAYIDNDGIHEWGDRISRRLSVGGDLTVNGEIRSPISITTDDDEPGYGLTISKGEADSHKMIKLQNRDASGTGYPTWSLYHRDDGGFGIGSLDDYDRLRLDSESKNVGLSASSPRSRLHIMTDDGEVDATYTAHLEQYHLLLHQSGNNNESQVGLGFRISTNDTGQTPGAAITHQRTGNQSKGKLHFKTKTTTASGTGLSTHMTISEDGNVGIGTTSPTSLLHVEDALAGTDLSDYLAVFQNTRSSIWVVDPDTGISSEAPRKILGLRFDAEQAGDPLSEDFYIRCHAGGTLKWFLRGDGVSSDTFTGQHWVVFAADSSSVNIKGDMSSELEPGMIVESTGEIWIRKDIETAIPKVSKCSSANSKMVFGVMSGDHASGLDLFYWNYYEGVMNAASKLPEDSEANDGLTYSNSSKEFKCRVNSIGEGSIWVTNANGDIENGDYITSSSVAGYGQLQDDDLLHNYTVAKCTESIDWTSVGDTVKHDGSTYKKYLCACTYHCG